MKNLAGVYVIPGRRSAYDNWNVLDVGESEDIKTRIMGHDRSIQWHCQGHSQIACAPIYGITAVSKEDSALSSFSEIPTIRLAEIVKY